MQLPRAGSLVRLRSFGLVLVTAAAASCGDDAGGNGDNGSGGSAAAPPSASGGNPAASGGASNATGGSATGGSAAGKPSGGAATQTGGAATSATGGASGPVGGTAGSGGAGGTSGAAGANGGVGPGGTASSGGSGGAAGAGTPAGGANSGGGAAGGSSSAATLVPDPSWACGMADGIPAPTSGKLVFRATLPIDQTHEVGATQYGQRRLLTSKSGMITGDRLQGSFLEGGLDFELTLSNGTIELERVDMLRSSDGALIYLRTCGIAPANEATVRIVPDFEVATSSSLAWLNTGKFAGTRSVDLTKKEIEYVVYDVSEAAAGEPLVRLQDPAGVPNQPWNCSTMTGQRGDTVFTEQVTLGGSLSVGASKRGTRNVIPITGGTVSGRITGKVVPGGADYQLVSGTSTLDARYALESNDGEVIIVRNCGPFGALIPLFETRAESDYAYLNANTFLSSDPGVGGGGVSITFYERR